MLHFSLVQKTMCGLWGSSFTERNLDVQHEDSIFISLEHDIIKHRSYMYSEREKWSPKMHLHFASQSVLVAEVPKPENAGVQSKLFSHLSCLQPFKTQKQSVSTTACQKNSFMNYITFSRNRCKHGFYHSIWWLVPAFC